MWYNLVIVSMVVKMENIRKCSGFLPFKFSKELCCEFYG